MKRCIICGNVDDDNSTVCSVCGNHYVTVPEDSQKEGTQPEDGQLEGAASGESEKPLQSVPEEHIQSTSGQNERPARPAMEGRPPRRTRSGPQIYGQPESMQGNMDMYAGQGAIRRTVRGGRPEGRPEQRQSRPVGQNMDRAGDRVQENQNRPAGQTPSGTGRSWNQMPSGTDRSGDQTRPGDQARQVGSRPGGPSGTGRPVSQDFRSRRVLETARAALRSPMFLLIAILYTVRLISSILAIFMDELNYSQISRLLSDVTMPQQAAGYFNTVTSLLQKMDSGSMTLPNIAVRIPDILFCLGLWLIVINARTAREKMSGIGFTLTRVIVGLHMVAACITMLMVLVISVAIVVAAWVADGRQMLAAAIAILVIVAIITIMVIMYYFCFLATLKTCRVNSNTGESYGKVSIYVALIHIVCSLTAVIDLLSGIVNMEITGITGAVGRMGWMILFGVWIFMYRAKMERLED